MKKGKETADKYKQYKNVFYQKNKGKFALTVMCVIFGCVIQTYLARLCQMYLDINKETDVSELVRLVIISVVFVACAAIILYSEKRLKFTFIKRAISGYRDHVFSDITQKDIGSFGNENTSSYISALTNDIASIEKNYLLNTFDLIEMVFLFVISFGMMIWYSPVMTVAVLLLCSIPMVISILMGDKIAVQEKAISNQNATFVSLVKDLLSGFTVIKSFKAEKEAIDLYTVKNNELESVKCSRQLTAGVLKVITGVANISVQIAIFGFGAFLVIKGQTTAGVVFAFVQLMGSVLDPIGQIPELLANRKAANALIDKMIELTGTVENHAGEEVLTDIGNGITFEHVDFAYEEDSPILKDVNVTFEKGKSYAIVGGSGSGKSTLLNLIMGNYMNYSGAIKIAGKEMKSINKNTIFDVISVIQQNVFVFDDTIMRNICMFKQFDREQVEEAVSKAGLKKLLLAKSDDYMCGENGKNLSGGERQRISIARSLLKNAKVLLVDEATAALDAETSKNVINSILAIEDVTKIVITHKMDEQELSRYDEIIVLKNGRVVEQGAFENLLGNKNYFYSLYHVNKETS